MIYLFIRFKIGMHYEKVLFHYLVRTINEQVTAISDPLVINGKQYAGVSFYFNLFTIYKTKAGDTWAKSLRRFSSKFLLLCV